MFKNYMTTCSPMDVSGVLADLLTAWVANFLRASTDVITRLIIPLTKKYLYSKNANSLQSIFMHICKDMLSSDVLVQRQMQSPAVCKVSWVFCQRRS